jgi:hypothetical protein
MEKAMIMGLFQNIRGKTIENEGRDGLWRIYL